MWGVVVGAPAVLTATFGLGRMGMLACGGASRDSAPTPDHPTPPLRFFLRFALPSPVATGEGSDVTPLGVYNRPSWRSISAWYS